MGRPGVRWTNGSMKSIMRSSQIGSSVHDQENIQPNQSRERPGVRWTNGSMERIMRSSQIGSSARDQENIQPNQSRENIQPNQSRENIQPNQSRENIQPNQSRQLSPSRNLGSNSSQGEENTSGDTLNPTKTIRKRGPARPNDDWGTDKKLKIKLNRYNHPIGPTTSKLASQLGVMARNGTFCPITYTGWKCEGLEEYKKRIWDDVKNNCEVSDDYKDNCLKSVGKKWRSWKNELRDKYYKKYDNDEDRLNNVTDRVDPDQWKTFVEFNGSEMAKDRSKVNSANQKKKVMSHTTGRKSHAEVREEMTVDGVQPSRIAMFFETHRKKTGEAVDQASAEAMDAIKDILKDVSETKQTPEYLEKVFTDVLGRDTHGRVRTYGLGPCPTSVFGKEDKQFRDQYANDIETLRNDVREEIREEIRKEFADKFENMERKFETLASMFESTGNPVPRCPEKQPVHVQQVSDAHSSHHEFEDQQDHPLEVGMVVHLLCHNVPKKVVAEVVIMSKDPCAEIGGVQIGQGFWAVRIVKAILPREHLLISRQNIRTIAQAYKKIVAWRNIDIERK